MDSSIQKGRSLSPARLTAKRFFRNRLAAVGLWILGFMFLFSFVGGALTPYGQDQVFHRIQRQQKTVAGVSENTQLRFYGEMDPELQLLFSLAIGSNDSLIFEDTVYTLVQEGKELYSLYLADTLVGFACKDILTPGRDPSFTYAALKAWNTGASTFSFQEETYTLSETGDLFLGAEKAGHISRRVFASLTENALSSDFVTQVQSAIDSGQDAFYAGNRHYSLRYDPATQVYSVLEDTDTLVWDSYASPSGPHPLGTDKNGMDMLTRLMYGGRVSLIIGFIVVAISAVLGVLLGGLCGYFGGWTDHLVMRVVDIFYCIPSTPLLIILGAAMDGMRVDPQLRMLFLMLTLGFLGWPSIARLVRGQILSLREQDFMIAAEAAGLRTRRRIFRHLIPNVIPQLIVICTMNLGSTILTEATLSFLGLGVKFPFASWGNIMNDVANAHVLTSYWFVWVPAGICLMLTVLGFNFVGDGLRDAFDPRSRR